MAEQTRREIREAQLNESRGSKSRPRSSARPSQGDANDSGRPGKKPRSRLKKWLIRGGITAAIMGLIGTIGLAYLWFTTPIPQPNEYADAQVSIIYYADGKTELARMVLPGANRESVSLARVPSYVQKEHLTAEDRSFYSNNGVSPAGIARAIKSSVSGDAQQGGSTITQQYVKNYFLTSDRTITRKAKEIIISLKVDGQLSKDQILENYLNTIYYGRGAYGIQSAARAYFGVDVGKLTIAQGAVLASVLNAPSLYDPALGGKNLARLEARYQWVLDGMVTEGWLDQAKRDQLNTMPPIKEYKRPVVSGPSGYVTAMVRSELKTIGLTDDQIDQGGLRITTTLNPTWQRAAYTAMKDNLPEGVTGGLVAIKPGDGAIQAIYAGDDYSTKPLNTATQAVLQGGSNFKPFAVLAALKDGKTLRDTFDGNSPQDFNGTPVTNYGLRSYGMVNMRRMIARSINTAFVELNQEIGPERTKQAAIDAGIPANTPGLDDSLTNVLGSASPHVIDMANAYATIAGNGKRAKPYIVAKVTSTNGEFSYTAKPATTVAFDPDITANTIDAMTGTVAPGGTATKLARLSRPIAGKTGTSQENKSIWFSGFVPQLSVSVGLYSPDKNGNMMTIKNDGLNATGGTIPADVWFDFMSVAFETIPVADFPKPTEATPTNPSFGPPTIAPPTSTTTTPPTTQPTTTQPTSTPPPVTTPPVTTPPVTTPPPTTPAATSPPATTGPPTTPPAAGRPTQTTPVAATQ